MSALRAVNASDQPADAAAALTHGARTVFYCPVTNDFKFAMAELRSELRAMAGRRVPAQDLFVAILLDWLAEPDYEAIAGAIEAYWVARDGEGDEHRREWLTGYPVEHNVPMPDPLVLRVEKATYELRRRFNKTVFRKEVGLALVMASMVDLTNEQLLEVVRRYWRLRD